MNFLLKMLANLAPYPFRPPVVFFSSSSKLDPCGLIERNHNMM